MTIEDLIVFGKKTMHSVHVNLLLSEITGYNPIELLNHLNEIVDQEKVEKFKECIKRLNNNEPIQYVLQNVNFYGYIFEVNKNVLIPRFETEELVENTIKFIKEKFDGKAKVIDLGCGSGVIGIVLKLKLPELDVTCLDISKDALEVAQKNASRLKADVKFIEGDMLNDISSKYDVIISNPPYIGESEVIQDIVKNNEPSIALYGGEDGLKYYNQILKTISKNLNDKFLIGFEIGYLQKDSIIRLINTYLTNVTITCLKDLSGKDRMIFIENK